MVLIGGDPGIGKSTLLLQALTRMSERCKVVYVSGEESAQQIALRSRRVQVQPDKLGLLAEIQLEQIFNVLNSEKPDVAVIDSIQTVYSESLQSDLAVSRKFASVPRSSRGLPRPATARCCWSDT